jgi:hypothetical protein
LRATQQLFTDFPTIGTADAYEVRKNNMTAPNLVVYKQPCFPHDQLSMKNSFPYTVSLTRAVAAKWHERAKAAKVNKSVYMTQLIEEDYAKPKRRLIMMDEKDFAQFQKFRRESAYPSRDAGQEAEGGDEAK